MPYLVRLSLLSFLNGTTNSAILPPTSWPILWLAKISNKSISLTTRLVVTGYKLGLNLNLKKVKKKLAVNPCNLFEFMIGFSDWIYIGDTGVFYFDNIGAEDVKLFLLMQTYKSFLFLSETMDIFCLAGSAQHAQ